MTTFATHSLMPKHLWQVVLFVSPCMRQPVAEGPQKRFLATVHTVLGCGPELGIHRANPCAACALPARHPKLDFLPQNCGNPYFEAPNQCPKKTHVPKKKNVHQCSPKMPQVLACSWASSFILNCCRSASWAHGGGVEYITMTTGAQHCQKVGALLLIWKNGAEMTDLTPNMKV